jgi:hypothetical protein
VVVRGNKRRQISIGCALCQFLARCFSPKVILYNYTFFLLILCPRDDSLVHCAWEAPGLGFVWYIIGYDREYDLFYGYVNLNDLANAEWGIIDREEMKGSFYASRTLVVQRWVFSLHYTFSNGPISILHIPYRAADMISLI